MLSGIRVVSFTHFLQGPSATQMLADLGAEVVKIESPAGAFERSWSGPDAYVGDASVFFLLGNRNVQSLSIDLKSEKAKSILLKLIDDADVLIESFRPGALKRLGFGYEELSARNPRLVYCSLSGYGSAGPYRDRPGQDLLLQSLSGLAHATGSADSPPTSVGASVIDQHGAVLGAFGILGALLGRERTGKGCKVESNLLNAALDLQIEPISYYLNGFRGERSSTGIGSRYYKAPYGIYRTADGHITVSITALSILSEAFDDDWFTTIAADDEYDRREEINERISKHLAERTTQEWEAHFTEHKVWFAPVNDYEAVVNDAQVLHNNSFLEFDYPGSGPVKVLAHPIRYDGQTPAARTLPPALGEHTESILSTLGLNDSEIDALAQEGVVRVHNA
ncbi:MULTISPECIES: CoA transferase [Rhodococcus]|uniref:CaiB/BaiF CoA transferase family protein n=1 Tax=Rhodococcus TaxID=1827 RepID=UPI00106353AE|nr:MULTISPECIES: CoA transferase [Rhodococcus]MDI9977424.1 CoA transferase [Rhodococcus sp. IEGM 1307]NDV04991.1 CoA transferase [Rhodococcus sp. IEGM 248]QSE86688.1 CoA transferase [Rhodococcus koreensis]